VFYLPTVNRRVTVPHRENLHEDEAEAEVTFLVGVDESEIVGLVKQLCGPFLRSSTLHSLMDRCTTRSLETASRGELRSRFPAGTQESALPFFQPSQKNGQQTRAPPFPTPAPATLTTRVRASSASPECPRPRKKPSKRLEKRIASESWEPISPRTREIPTWGRENALSPQPRCARPTSPRSPAPLPYPLGGRVLHFPQCV
jgi:hypothetical protein